MELNLLEKSILATIVYYDVLDYPLTGFEIFKYLINPSYIIAQSKPEQALVLGSLTQPCFLDTLKALKNKSLKNYIEEKNGFYFLKNRAKLYETRIERQKTSDQKWKKARKIIKYLQIIPYLRMIAISGSLAIANTKKQSDIDLLIITKHKRIWTNRFLITSFIHLLGKRRHNKKTADRLCLNHYITDKSLKIDFPSLYNAQTYAHLMPVSEIEQGIYKKFQKANQWIKTYLTFYPKEDSPNQRLIKGRKFLQKIARFQEIILDTFLGTILEKILAIIQKTIMKKHSSKEKGQGRVITDDFQLEFHPASPEIKILDKYNKIMLKLGFRTKPEKNSGLL
jgi:predicted nucleotidyltransferase